MSRYHTPHDRIFPWQMQMPDQPLYNYLSKTYSELIELICIDKSRLWNYILAMHLPVLLKKSKNFEKTKKLETIHLIYLNTVHSVMFIAIWIGVLMLFYVTRLAYPSLDVFYCTRNMCKQKRFSLFRNRQRRLFACSRSVTIPMG